MDETKLFFLICKNQMCRWVHTLLVLVWKLMLPDVMITLLCCLACMMTFFTIWCFIFSIWVHICITHNSFCVCRYTPSMPRRQLFNDIQRERCVESDHHIYYSEHGDSFSCSNFVDLDWLSSSGNSCEEEPYERYCIPMKQLCKHLAKVFVAGIFCWEWYISNKMG